MITCPTCGAQNDPVNRFCDQCGTRLESEEIAAAPPSAAQAPTAAMTCPTCGAAVVPGEAFCETCGAALSAPTAASPEQPVANMPVANDAPTVAAAPPDSGARGAEKVCPACGQLNLADARYCDICGAELSPGAGPDDATMVAPPANEPTSPLNDDTMMAQPDDPTMVVPPTEPPVAPAEETTPPAAPTPPDAGDATPPAPPDDETLEQPTLITGEPEVEADRTSEAGVSEVAADQPAEPAAPASTTMSPETDAAADTIAAPTTEPPAAETPPVSTEPAAPVEETTPAAPATDTAAERQRLEALITAHRETISQYEQMLSRYPAGAAPAFLTAGLDEARDALSQSEAELAALPDLPAGPDPAEVQRLEELIAAHRETISQYEQMLSRYPAGAAPAFLTAGLDEARNALSQSEAELSALTGGATSASATTPPAAAAPAVPAAGDTLAPTPTASPPAPAGARIVLVDGGHELALPAGKTAIIVGREDPVSNIFPEIDMTPFGGESGGVSRQHARLDLAGGQWTLTDLNSTNYTRVDGTRIEPNTPTPIHDGSRIQFGRIAAIFHT